MNKQIGARLSTFRQAANLTQVQLAEKLGITQPALASYEIGRRSLPLNLLMALSQILKISVDQLLENKKSKIKKPGPESHLEKQILEVKALPRSEQKYVSRFLDQVLSKNATKS